MLKQWQRINAFTVCCTHGRIYDLFAYNNKKNFVYNIPCEVHSSVYSIHCRYHILWKKSTSLFKLFSFLLSVFFAGKNWIGKRQLNKMKKLLFFINSQFSMVTAYTEIKSTGNMKNNNRFAMLENENKNTKKKNGKAGALCVFQLKCVYLFYNLKSFFNRSNRLTDAKCLFV